MKASRLFTYGVIFAITINLIFIMVHWEDDVSDTELEFDIMAILMIQIVVPICIWIGINWWLDNRYEVVRKK